MEEIGCHFKFEKIIGNIYHDTNLLLSSGRNCLKYIINERNIFNDSFTRINDYYSGDNNFKICLLCYVKK